MNILVFPANLLETQIWSAQMLALHHQTFGASYSPETLEPKYFSQVFYLPAITDSDFVQALQNLISTHKIETFYSPHLASWSVLSRHFPEGSALNSPPHLAHNQLQHFLQSALYPLKKQVSQNLPDLFQTNSPLVLGLLRHVLEIPGQTSLAKILRLGWALAQAPEGDIVEIGSAWGRSAFALAWFAQYYQRGTLLCIDPWSADFAQGHGLLDQLNSELNYEGMYQDFLQHLLPFFGGKMNVLRETSEAALPLYLHSPTIQHPFFGETTYTQKIALLHLDGNHHLEMIKQDLTNWAPLVLPGGWIVVDDYDWAFGQGPKIAADAFLEKNAAQIAQAFVLEDNLWIQLAGVHQAL